jgi:outer membrane protein insertion porin family
VPEPRRRSERSWRVVRFLTVVLPCVLALATRPAVAQTPAGDAPNPDARRLDTPATEAPAKPPVITRISVQGNAFTDSTRILRTFEVHRGQTFAADAVRRGLRKLGALGLFSDYKVNRIDHPETNTVELIIVVTERPRIAKISFEGMKKREDSDLEKKLFLKVGETYSPTTTANQVDSLKQYYKEEGFPRAKLTAHPDTVEGRNEVNLRFVVDEGEKLRITRVLFEGRSAFSEKKLRKTMKTHVKGFLGGGDLKDETFAEDREKLEGYYHDHGYRDMSVTDFKLEPGATPRELTLRVVVDEGRPYRQGTVTWTGNKLVPTAALDRQWPRQGGSLYSHARIQKALRGAYSEYMERGYLYLNIEPRDSVVRDSVIDLTFAVGEGLPSHVRRVSITGNKGTREKVIRREINIREGDLFRQSAMVRSRDDVMRLGIFNDVIPDFTPADSSDVDMVFKVTEKQVGTASAGAGFTNEAGLTGFLEIGHNNVLGNNQQLSLHLERGGKRENYQLSFTEPWFHDSPTLLGFSAYNTFSILDEYDQRRRGVSGRIGRPLPWPDYSRGSVSYTFEGLKFTNIRSGIQLGGITVGKEELNSTLELNFLRNSTDNPFYATRGTRLSLSEEYTGGPFGGDLNYHLHRYEGRAYLPSILRRITTMVRLRLGTVNVYPWSSGVIPDYARFRLGGGNTIDPLRGYDDYQIVPGKFARNDTTFFDVNRNDGKDTTTVTRVRYPGGRYMALFTMEQQFPIVHPLHGVLFFDAGNTWDLRPEIRPFDLKVGAGLGFRMEIPLLGNIGFDYGYGFQRDDRPRWVGHFMLGNVNF